MIWINLLIGMALALVVAGVVSFAMQQRRMSGSGTIGTFLAVFAIFSVTLWLIGALTGAIGPTPYGTSWTPFVWGFFLLAVVIGAFLVPRLRSRGR